MKKIWETFYKNGEFNITEGFKENWQFLLTWILGIILLSVVIYFILHYVRKKRNIISDNEITKSTKKKEIHIDTKILVTGALCIGLSFVLSYIKLWSMPQGGSITLASTLPIIFFAYTYGWKKGLTVAFTFSILQLIQSPHNIMSIPQAFIDYVLAFTFLGIAGFFTKNIYLGIITGHMLKLASHITAGFIWYLEFNSTSFNAVPYVVLYNVTFLIPDMLICIIVVSIPAVKRMLLHFKKQKV